MAKRETSTQIVKKIMDEHDAVLRGLNNGKGKLRKKEGRVDMPKSETSMQIAKKLLVENDELYRSLNNGKGKAKKKQSH